MHSQPFTECMYVHKYILQNTSLQYSGMWRLIHRDSLTEAHAQCGEVNTLRAITPQ